MVLFKRYSIPILCSKERFLATLQRSVYTCSMARSCFPIDALQTKPLVGSIQNDKVRLRFTETLCDGLLISRGCQPILHGRIISTENDSCVFVYRFFPDSFLLPFLLLWLAGALFVSIRKSNYLLLLSLIFPYLIAKPIFSICASRMLKQLHNLIESI